MNDEAISVGDPETFSALVATVSQGDREFNANFYTRCGKPATTDD